MPKILLADDPNESREDMNRVSQLLDCEMVEATDQDHLFELVQEGIADAVILANAFQPNASLDLYRRITEIDPHLPVIFLTRSTNSRTAIEATKLGALDYLIRPIDADELYRALQRGLEIRRLASEPVSLNPEDADKEDGDALIGRSPAMQDVYKSIGRVASQSVPVLIRGASGTGKELVARAIFQFGNRADKPFMAINCAAIPDALLESELFGHEKGAFTGADKKRIGKFEQCDGGTLFLDEIGDMSTVLQSKLLRILQEQAFERVGGTETIRTNVRVISATHRELEDMVENGQFRGDLFYRLNGYTIMLPSLSDRGSDLADLIEHFRIMCNQELGKKVKRFSEAALKKLHGYSWPGNVRELQSVVRRSILQTTGDVVIDSFLPPLDWGETAPVPSNEPVSLNEQVRLLARKHFESGGGEIYDHVIEQIERALLTEVLELTGGNQVEASEKLGITRTTLRSKIAKHGIHFNKAVKS